VPVETRLATPGDTTAVLSVDDGTWVSARRTSLVAARVAARDCLVSEWDGRVVAFALIHPQSFFGRDFVELLVVDSDFRRRGVANALLVACAQRSTSRDLFISTNRSNLPMRSLLLREQWLFSGELAGIDEDDPELVFYKNSGLDLPLGHSVHEAPGRGEDDA